MTVKAFGETDMYDVIVIGAGHAGCEAGLAAARLGKKTLMLTISLESVAMMPCNPSIGGTGKGQLVREIDALGGEMGINIDKTFIQSRMLNATKGPAVHSPRAQADKQRYHEQMKHTLEKQENLILRQGEVTELLFEEPLRVTGVRLRTGAVYGGKTVILATGTYLNGRIHVSGFSWPSGPSGLTPSLILPENLKKNGFVLRKFKTGTPARVLSHTLDYSKLLEQKGDGNISPFSFMTDDPGENKRSCWLTWTNEKSHRIVAENIEKTAPYGGYTTGVGPRYCLSIEDKVSRFPDRRRHQLFLEPEGLSTEEVYVQGMSTSLPEHLQLAFYRSIEGLERAEISRYAYSIEYDCLDPLSLTGALEHREAKNLFCAGQINGSSGYEEAAAQGLMAGVNAVRRIDGKEPFVLDRSEAYIGVLIDDLTTKGTDEPYRIMTSRAEFRLALRQDNADIRLTEKGRGIGLASQDRHERYLRNKRETEEEMRRLGGVVVPAREAAEFLGRLGKTSAGTTDAPVTGASAISCGKTTLAALLKRPEVTYDNLREIDRDRPDVLAYARKQAEIQIKYEGYIDRQNKQIEKFKKLESKRIPQGTDYYSLNGLRPEAAQKLSDKRPVSIGQASRISGVSPADVNVLLIHLARKAEGGKRHGR
ncbi:MAG: tRNA uridine-5-carboxymethylaminomethyl(34) synthesis enzyme MnmG [Clostridiales Family XIII bacterium]|jgi:tRNA uridine 5-carboxymethylaminomethyl modification enzyme|nr:tRNA uridine-5-carboxymethylaminomethyl(34) synthesis enzyme MnmG [Clostridiales Family XIII bacterium]